MTQNLIILAAGMSSRMKKSTQSELLSSSEVQQANERSKGLISLDSSGRPLLDYILYNAYKAGIRRVYIVTGVNNELFRQQYGMNLKGNYYHGLTLSYAIQYIPDNRIKPLGTADAVYQTLEQYPQLKLTQFLVCNSDNLYSENAFRLLVTNGAANALIAYNIKSLKFSNERLRNFAILEVNRDQYLVNIVEKPKQKELSKYATEEDDLSVSMNIFKFDGRQFFSYVRDCPMHIERNEKELPVALLHMIAEQPEAMVAIKLSEHVPDLTSKTDIPTLKNYIKQFDFSAWS